MELRDIEYFAVLAEHTTSAEPHWRSA